MRHERNTRNQCEVRSLIKLDILDGGFSKFGSGEIVVVPLIALHKARKIMVGNIMVLVLPCKTAGGAHRMEAACELIEDPQHAAHPSVILLKQNGVSRVTVLHPNVADDEVDFFIGQGNARSRLTGGISIMDKYLKTPEITESYLEAWKLEKEQKKKKARVDDSVGDQVLVDPKDGAIAATDESVQKKAKRSDQEGFESFCSNHVKKLFSIYFTQWSPFDAAKIFFKQMKKEVATVLPVHPTSTSDAAAGGPGGRRQRSSKIARTSGKAAAEKVTKWDCYEKWINENGKFTEMDDADHARIFVVNRMVLAATNHHTSMTLLLTLLKFVVPSTDDTPRLLTDQGKAKTALARIFGPAHKSKRIQSHHAMTDETEKEKSAANLGYFANEPVCAEGASAAHDIIGLLQSFSKTTTTEINISLVEDVKDKLCEFWLQGFHVTVTKALESKSFSAPSDFPCQNFASWPKLRLFASRYLRYHHGHGNCDGGDGDEQDEEADEDDEQEAGEEDHIVDISGALKKDLDRNDLAFLGVDLDTLIQLGPSMGPHCETMTTTAKLLEENALSKKQSMASVRKTHKVVVEGATELWSSKSSDLAGKINDLLLKHSSPPTECELRRQVLASVGTVVLKNHPPRILDFMQCFYDVLKRCSDSDLATLYGMSPSMHMQAKLFPTKESIIDGLSLRAYHTILLLEEAASIVVDTVAAKNGEEDGNDGERERRERLSGYGQKLKAACIFLQKCLEKGARQIVAADSDAENADGWIMTWLSILMKANDYVAAMCPAGNGNGAKHWADMQRDLSNQYSQQSVAKLRQTAEAMGVAHENLSTAAALANAISDVEISKRRVVAMETSKDWDLVYQSFLEDEEIGDRDVQAVAQTMTIQDNVAAADAKKLEIDGSLLVFPVQPPLVPFLESISIVTANITSAIGILLNSAMADKGRHLLVKKVGAQSKQGPRLFVRTEDLSNAPGESLHFINLCLTGTVCTSLGDALVKNAVLVAEVSKGIGSVRVYCHPPKENSELNLDSCVPGWWVRAVDEAKEMPTMCIHSTPLLAAPLALPKETDIDSNDFDSAFDPDPATSVTANVNVNLASTMKVDLKVAVYSPVTAAISRIRFEPKLG